MEAPSKELLKRVKEGQEGAFEELYLSYYQDIYGMAFFLLKNHHDAEDAVQNTFLRVYTGIRSLKTDESFVRWLDTIANNECFRLMQSTKPVAQLDEESEARYIEAVEEEFALPAVYAEKKDLSRRLWKLLLELPVEQRQALVLHYYHQLSVKDIAEITGVSVGTVTSRLYYARSKIRKFIEQQEKKTGDKFYGVPLLPMSGVLERLLAYNAKEKKDHPALWAGFQKELRSLSSSFGGTSSVSFGDRFLGIKITAAVIAAAMLIGSVAAAFAGEAPDAGRGWSNLVNGGQTDPERKAPIDPTYGENNAPAPYNNPNANTPLGNTGYAQNIADQPQNNNADADNNSQEQQILPSQSVVQNPLTAPTQALTNPTEQPAVAPSTAPTSPSPTQNNGVYQAYRDLLQQNAQAINAYSWQYSDTSLPVALADIYGDSTPELLFLSASGNTARLNIYTYDGTKTVSLPSGSALSSNADIDDTYFLFQKSGDKRLYLYTADDNDYGTSRCIRFDESGSGLTATELCSSRSYPSRFIVDNDVVSTSAYSVYESSLFSDISSILIRNDMRGSCSLAAYNALERHSSKAMSLNDMLEYLEER